MKIRSSGGDDGSTSRLGGKRIRKSDPAIRAVGSLDELNAHLGLCVQAAGDAPAVRAALEPLQVDLFRAGAILAAAGTPAAPGVTLDEQSVRRIEQAIASAAERLPELTHFILPGGCELACRLHVARAVCRRTEREIVAVADSGTPLPPALLAYINRLGDLLFALARLANTDAGAGEVQWQG